MKRRRWPLRKIVPTVIVLALVSGGWPQAAAALQEHPQPATFAYGATTEPGVPVVADAGVRVVPDARVTTEAGAGRANTIDGIDQTVVDSVVRLYLAVFERQPDREGLAYWVDTYLNGTALFDIAAGFMASTEWSNRYGSVDDDRFVELLYGNVLRRAPDDEGRHYWRALLAGGLARAELLLQFSESTEFVAKTGTVEPAPPYPPIPADSGTGRRIVYGNDAQRVWLVEEDGSVADSYLVSGRRDMPAPGTYDVYSKSVKAWAGHDGITMDHMVRFARGRRLAIGFHSIPTYADGRPMQTLDDLGTYRSAGCVRQDPVKAKMLYDWADIGTTVVVLD
ncbi:MAG: DUF4214 domain-containing protein [Acidimicrobiales bacterium]